jgi:SOS regulatory protein LexA
MIEDYKKSIMSFYQRENRMPTYTEMMSLFGFKSKNAVARIVQKFVDMGFVSKDHLGRLIPDVSMNDIPLLGSVKAGIPADVFEQSYDTVNISNYLAPQKSNTFMLTVDGESMIDAHIEDGDMVLVEKTSKARDGDIVVADVDGEFTMKYFRQQGAKVWLEPANKNFKNIYPEQYMTISGVVKAVIRKY